MQGTSDFTYNKNIIFLFFLTFYSNLLNEEWEAYRTQHLGTLLDKLRSSMFKTGLLYHVPVIALCTQKLSIIK